MVDFINGAVSSIDYCCYNSSRSDVVQALIAARNRGVQVRVITDDSRLDDDWVASLRSNGIPVWSDSGFPGAGYYMHNKFVVRDLGDNDSTNDRLWTGSYNPNQNELNADFALEISHTGLARAYLAEFNQMWGSTGGQPERDSARFHSRKQDVLATHQFIIDGYPVNIFFAPQDRVVDSITSLVNRARKDVIFTIFSFTYSALAQTLVERWNQGVKIAGTIDKSGANDPASQYPFLKNQGIPILVDSVPFGNGVLHEKMMLIDYHTAIVGSANWSNNANFNNDENLLVITNPDWAKLFYPELVARYVEAGGTVPPGIEEIQIQQVPVRRIQLRNSFQPMPGETVYDVTGRKKPSGAQLGSGIFLLFSDFNNYRVVLAR